MGSFISQPIKHEGESFGVLDLLPQEGGAPFTTFCASARRKVFLLFGKENPADNCGEGGHGDQAETPH